MPMGASYMGSIEELLIITYPSFPALMPIPTGNLNRISHVITVLNSGHRSHYDSNSPIHFTLRVLLEDPKDFDIQKEKNEKGMQSCLHGPRQTTSTLKPGTMPASLRGCYS
jgi:hypothetical protein